MRRYNTFPLTCVALATVTAGSARALAWEIPRY